MSNQMARNQKCIVIRNGIQLWIEEGDKLSRLEGMLGSMEGNTRIYWEGRTINTADLVGIYLPEDMDDVTRRKNNQRQCSFGTWHDKGQECACNEGKRSEEAEKFFRENGYYQIGV